MSVVLGIKEQAVLISLLKREIARIEAQELAFKVKTTSLYVDRKRLQSSVGEPTSEEIETKNICRKILNNIVESLVENANGQSVSFYTEEVK